MTSGYNLNRFKNMIKNIRFENEKIVVITDIATTTFTIYDCILCKNKDNVEGYLLPDDSFIEISRLIDSFEEADKSQFGVYMPYSYFNKKENIYVR